MRRLRSAYLLLLLAFTAWCCPATAQLQRGPRTLIRGGLMDKPDSLKQQRDSLRTVELAERFDSLAAADYAADSAALYLLRTDDIRTLDSTMLARFESGYVAPDTVRRRLLKKGWLMSDSMSLS